jgi:hypothetical protein
MNGKENMFSNLDLQMIFGSRCFIWVLIVRLNYHGKLDYKNDFSGGLKLCAMFDFIRILEIIFSGQLENELGKI